MAGLFRAPKPVVVAPQSASTSTTTSAQSASAQSAATTEQASETARIEGRASSRQGLAGTIATSARGVLAPVPLAVTRKSLLGE